MPSANLSTLISQDKKLSPVLMAENATVCYDSDPASVPQLKRINLTIPDSSVTAVIGPNGAGKTALIRTLSRTLPTTSGKITLDGRDLYTELSINEAALSISVVPQITELFLDFTVREIIAMGRAPHRNLRSALAPESGEDHAAINSAMEALNINTQLGDRSISHISGGERQRTLIARALVQQSPIILADEPTASLDLQGQHSLLSTLRSLAHESGKTVLVVLHDLNSAAEYADQIVVIANGEIVADGTPEKVLTADMVRDVYKVNAEIGVNPVTGKPNVIVVPG
jgi:iron complex transport system ATP-binding protein